MFTYDSITMRTVEERDLEPMRSLRNDPSTWMMLTDIGFLERERQAEWFKRVQTATDRRYYVICDDTYDFIGIIRTDEIDRTNRSMRVGADVVPELRGKGYGHRAYRMLLTYCFDYLNMHRVWLAVLESNTRARRLYEKCGFVLEGRYRSAVFRGGAYQDYLLMSILEEEVER